MLEKIKEYLKTKLQDNQFTLYDDYTILQLLHKIIIPTISNIIDDVKTKVSFDDMKNIFNFKEVNGKQDYQGSWHGIEKPSLSTEGVSAMVEQHQKDLEKLNKQNSTFIHLLDMTGNTLAEKFIAAITYCTNNGYRNLFLPNGHYDFTGLINDRILLEESFDKINIVGENAKYTILDYSNTGLEGTFLKVRGGSGSLCLGSISNVTFKGSQFTNALELNNVCGYKAINCVFDSNKVGVLMNNSGNGFTEFNVIENCDFRPNCITHLEYRKEGTQRSFHGSGLKDCVINQGSTDTIPKIIIGSGCLPYHAPLSFTVFTRTTTPVIKNDGVSGTNFLGNICVEPFNTSDVNIVDGTVYIVGGVITHRENVKLGGLIPCDKIQLNSDGSINTFRKTYSRTYTLNTEINELIGFQDDNTQLVDILISTNGYENHNLLLCCKGTNTTQGFCSSLGVLRNLDTSNIGVPTFAIENNKLRVTNKNYIGKNVTCMITVTQLGARRQMFSE